MSLEEYLNSFFFSGVGGERGRFDSSELKLLTDLIAWDNFNVA